MTRTLPKTRREWTRLAFWSSETLVVGMTVRMIALQASEELWQDLEFAPAFYWVYAAAFVALAVSSISVRRAFPALATLGWMTIALLVLLAGYSPPRY